MNPQAETFYEKDLPPLDSHGIKKVHMNKDKVICLSMALYMVKGLIPDVYDYPPMKNWNTNLCHKFQSDLLNADSHLYLISVDDDPSQEVLDAVQTFKLWRPYHNLLVFREGVCIYRIHVDQIGNVGIDYLVNDIDSLLSK